MIIAELFAKFGLLPDEKSWDKGHELIEGLHTALEAYLGYEGLKKMGELVEGTVEAAQSAKHLSEQLGETTDAVQELNYAAEASDVPAETLNGAMQRLARSLEQVKTHGSGPAADALQKLGVHMKDLKGETLDQNLEVIADAFKKMPDGAQKAALSMELFGRSAGPRMLQLMNQGKDGIVALRNEAHELGYVMDEEAIENADKLDESQKKLKASLIGIRNEAVSALLPVLTEMAEGLGEWVKQNREAIVAGLQAVLHGIATAFHVVGSALSFVIDLFKDHQDVVMALIIAIGILQAKSIAAAVASAVAWALAFAPLVLAVAAITGVVLAIKKVVEHFMGAKVTLADFWHGIIAGGEAAVEWISALPGKVADFFGEVRDAIISTMDEAWDYVVQKAQHAWNVVKSPFEKLASIGRDVISNVTGIVQHDAGVSVPPEVSEGAAGILQGGDVSISAGDTNITVQGAGSVDPDELASKIKSAVDESHKDMLRQAHSNLSGGKR